MNIWLITIPAFCVFCIGSYCTYTKEVRDSWMYIPIFVGLSLTTGWLWAVSSRRLETTNSILLLSLVWDVLMVMAYYAGPLIFKGGFNWQAYAAAAVAVAGICWFKVATS